MSVWNFALFHKFALFVFLLTFEDLTIKSAYTNWFKRFVSLKNTKECIEISQSDRFSVIRLEIKCCQKLEKLRKMVVFVKFRIISKFGSHCFQKKCLEPSYYFETDSMHRILYQKDNYDRCFDDFACQQGC
jgi:hypothetical protein